MTVIGVPPRPSAKTAIPDRSAVRKLRHLLLLTDKRGRRAVSLNAALHSLGSASDSAIVLESDTVADLHALFIRVPDPKAPGGYRYRIVSGRASGFEGTSSIVVNGKRCFSHDLQSGDRVWFGNDTKLSYHVAALTDEELATHVRPASFRRVKSSPATPTATLPAVLPKAALTMSDLMANFSRESETILR